MSVDLYLEQVIAGAKLVVVRLLGGRAYWAYGVDRLAAFCRERGVALAVLPGDAREDPELAERSTLRAEDRARLWGYLVHGGIGNSGQLLRFAATLLGRADAVGGAAAAAAGLALRAGPAGADAGRGDGRPARAAGRGGAVLPRAAAERRPGADRPAAARRWTPRGWTRWRWR